MQLFKTWLWKSCSIPFHFTGQKWIHRANSESKSRDYTKMGILTDMIQRGPFFVDYPPHIVSCASQDRSGCVCSSHQAPLSPSPSKHRVCFLLFLLAWYSWGQHSAPCSHAIHLMVPPQSQHDASEFSVAGESRIRGTWTGKETLWLRSDTVTSTQLPLSYSAARSGEV